jgi:hypothetical protein
MFLIAFVPPVLGGDKILSGFNSLAIFSVSLRCHVQRVGYRVSVAATVPKDEVCQPREFHRALVGGF